MSWIVVVALASISVTVGCDTVGPSGPAVDEARGAGRDASGTRRDGMHGRDTPAGERADKEVVVSVFSLIATIGGAPWQAGAGAPLRRRQITVYDDLGHVPMDEDPVRTARDVRAPRTFVIGAVSR